MSNLAPLVADRQFLVATRDTGYRDVAAAIAELVDNSVQAGATDVHIVLRPEPGEAKSWAGPSNLTVAVLDNGSGIKPSKLQAAVQFGGTDRFNNRNGIGRFGMGLPNSSVSISRRLDVYSWHGWHSIIHTYLDITEIDRGSPCGIPDPAYRPLPGWAVPIAQSTGTLVVWSDCDRLGFRRIGALASKLRRKLGQVYRRLIWSGLRLFINNELVSAVDPLYCDPTGGNGGAQAYGPPLRFDIARPSGAGYSQVVVRYTELPVEAWHALTGPQKRHLGLAGGAGVSFVRAEREIDYCWQLMGKRRENYDDWWRCEILFEPLLDEYFGVTNSKQGVNPTAYLRSILEPQLEPIARQLNGRVRKAFANLRPSVPSRAVGRASNQDPLLPPLKSKRLRGRRNDGLVYAIDLETVPSRAFFRVSQEGGRVTLKINSDHPFYDELYAPAVAEDGKTTRFALECLLLAAGRAQLSAASTHSCAGAFLDEWSDALAAFLETRTYRK